jgi:uncharacterized protein (DUF3820 family)
MVQLHGIGDTALLFVSLLDTRRHAMDPEDLQRLVTQKMPYGKYKDRLLADLPGHYLAWFAREGFPAGQLGRSCMKSITTTCANCSRRYVTSAAESGCIKHAMKVIRRLAVVRCGQK